MKTFCYLYYFIFLFLPGVGSIAFAQSPVNDQCEQAKTILITQNGFSVGQFAGDTVFINEATIQNGESFAPAIRASGLDKKSVWYKFKLPVIRSVRVMLGRPGGVVGTNEAGFAVYKATSCMPTISQISTKLTPIASAGNTYHPCIDPGEYFIQVSASQTAIGSLNVVLQISDSTGAMYDHPTSAFDFGTIPVYGSKIDFNTGCLSITDNSEDCSIQSNTIRFTKSSWACFKTRNYFDHILLTFGGANGYYSTGNRIRRSVGFRIYKGNARTQAISELVLIQSCDSVSTNGYYLDFREFLCGNLDTSNYYTIQLLFTADFNEDFRLGLYSTGMAKGKAPIPDLNLFNHAGLPVDILPSFSGTSYTWNDQLACNNRVDSSSMCLPDFDGTGIVSNNVSYTLASYSSFKLLGNSGLEIKTTGLSCGPGIVTRVFKKIPVNGCTELSSDSLVAVIPYNTTAKLDCLETGTYIVQFLGRNELMPAHQLIYSLPTSTVNKCVRGNLGAVFQMQLRAYLQNPKNRFGLYNSTDYDQVGDLITGYLQPLSNSVPYVSTPDTLSCLDNVMPFSDALDSGFNKSVYRNFIIPDSGQLELSSLNDSLYYRVFSGWANQHVSVAGNVYPNLINDLIPIHRYLKVNDSCDSKRVCLIPGAYTLVANGKANTLRQIDRPTLKFIQETPKGHSPSFPEDMNSLLDSVPQIGGVYISNPIRWSCKDNVVSIPGFNPCAIRGFQPSKMIFREFYLRNAAHIIITENNNSLCGGFQSGIKALFSGRGSAGLTNLILVDSLFNCFRTAQPQEICETLPAGWYTLVSYGVGSSYENPVTTYNGILKESGFTGYIDQVKLVITPTCAAPRFNRPYKASIDIRTRQPYLLQWYLHAGSDPAFPRTDTMINLAPEFFNCSSDTPFLNHPFVACDSQFSKVAYFIFQTTQKAYIQIDTKGLTGMVYPFDVRRDSLRMLNTAPLQSCQKKAGYIQLCNLNPGIYTLMLLAGEENTCTNVAPNIYVDRIDTSRFDYASRCYDFGNINPDSNWHSGSANDRNPYYPQRAASNDFIYCTTGAFTSDPVLDSCDYIINDRIYSFSNNVVLFDSLNTPVGPKIPRRNLWYSFVINEGGNVRVKVDTKTPGRSLNMHMSLYASNADPSLSISQLRGLGAIDSTINQGLQFIASNIDSSCNVTSNEIVFYRNPCTEQPKRYFLIVDNPNNFPGADFPGVKPNTQLEVRILFDSVIAAPALFDHFANASEMGLLNPNRLIHGTSDNFTCATRSITDPIFPAGSNAQKTIWYHFTVNHTGTLRFRLRINGNPVVDYRSLHLLREVTAGDSTSQGLNLINLQSGRFSDSSGIWGTCCISPGSYYLLATGLNQRNEYVHPELFSLEDRGDFCSAPVNMNLNSAGVFTDSAIINCHTTGIDFGEEGPTLSCPLGANVEDYKSTWFRLNVSATDTLDIRTRILDHTTAGVNEISYRLIAGSCGAMQEQSCVQNSQTENTYQCLLPGRSYFVQVFTPKFKNGNWVTGNIQLLVTASRHTDTCILPPPCLATANFDVTLNCNPQQRVTIHNYSTFGSDISYLWQLPGTDTISTSSVPNFYFEPSPDTIWHSIKLKVTNHECNAADSIVKSIAIPPAPKRVLQPDSLICTRQMATILADGWPGTRYLWMNGSQDDHIQVGLTGHFPIKVISTYQNCSRVDSMHLYIARLNEPESHHLLLCSSLDSVILRVPGNGTIHYSWMDGFSDSIRVIRSAGSFIIQTSDSSCVVHDSFTIRERSYYSDLANDTFVCNHAFPFYITVRDTLLNQIIWSDNVLGSTRIINDSGFIKVRMIAENCEFADSMWIHKFAAALYQRDSFDICAGSTIVLPWGIRVDSEGEYSDTIRSYANCDSLIRSVYVHVKAKPELGNNQNDSFCRGSYFDLNDLYYNLSIDTIVWYRNWQTVLSPWVNEAAEYEGVAINRNGCRDTVRINLTMLPKPELGEGILFKKCKGDRIDLSSILENLSDWKVVYHMDTSFSNSVIASLHDSLYIFGENQFGCRDTLYNYVLLYPDADAGNDSIVIKCPQGITALNITNGNTNSYQWYYFDSNYQMIGATVSDSGIFHRVAVSSFGCADTASIKIRFHNQPEAGPDTTDSFCTGSYYSLNQLYSNYIATVPEFNWKRNNHPVPGPFLTQVPGSYILTVKNLEGCTDSAELQLQLVQSPDLIVRQPQPVCAPLTINIDDSQYYSSNEPIFQRQLWLDSICSLPLLNVICSKSDTLYVTIANQAGCQDTGRIYPRIFEVPQLLSRDTIFLCRNETARIFTNLSLVNYPHRVEWYPADQFMYQDNNYAITIPNPFGLLYVVFKDSVGCNFTLTDSVRIIAYPRPSVFAGDDLLSARNIPLQLHATGALHYRWSPAEPIISGEFTANPWIQPAENLMMIVIGTDEMGCVGKDTLVIQVMDGTTFYIPSSFTPNRDGLNDKIKITAPGIIQLFGFSIYNRWGQRVFQTKNIRDQWDGTFQGKELETGTYIYEISGKSISGRTIFKKGTILLIR